MLEMHPRERPPKAKLTLDIEESGNRILDEYLHGDENVPEITDTVSAMGKSITIKSGMVQKKANYQRKNKPSNENRSKES